MRHASAASCLILTLSLASAHAQQNAAGVAQGWRLTPELADAYREYAIARQQLILYRQVTLPLKRQIAADATTQTQWELAMLNRRLADYQPFLAVGDYSPVRTAAENDFLTRNATAQRLRQLQDEEIALMRFSGETDELYQYDVLRAAIRVRAAHAALGQ